MIYILSQIVIAILRLFNFGGVFEQAHTIGLAHIIAFIVLFEALDKFCIWFFHHDLRTNIKGRPWRIFATIIGVWLNALPPAKFIWWIVGVAIILTASHYKGGKKNKKGGFSKRLKNAKNALLSDDEI